MGLWPRMSVGRRGRGGNGGLRWHGQEQGAPGLHGQNSEPVGEEGPQKPQLHVLRAGALPGQAKMSRGAGRISK